MTNILILGASYGSLLGTKLAMAGHNVTLVCRQATADLINAEGTEVRIKLKGEEDHRTFRSKDFPGTVSAATPASVDVTDFDLVGLAMQEPQYGAADLKDLMARIAEANLPCLSIMNMPPLAYLRRIPGLDAEALRDAYAHPEVWDAFEPGLMSLCSPDPQAFRPPEAGANVLHVGLPTNFKAAAFDDEAHTDMVRQLEADIAAIRVDGQDVPVKLKVSGSIYVPLAKWSMLLTGNYRCILDDSVQPIKEAVHGDVGLSQSIYEHVDTIVQQLGADPADQVPFEKYANAATGLLKPSSAARAIDGGADVIERVDKLVQLVGNSRGLKNPNVDKVVTIVDARLKANAG